MVVALSFFTAVINHENFPPLAARGVDAGRLSDLLTVPCGVVRPLLCTARDEDDEIGRVEGPIDVGLVLRGEVEPLRTIQS